MAVLLAERGRAGVQRLVAPIAARAVRVHVAAARGLAQVVGAARAGAADGRGVGRRAGTSVDGVAALAVAYVADRRFADQCSGRCRARPVQGRVGVRGVGRDAGAVRELDAAGMAGLVAPLACRAITVDVAAALGLAQEIRAARAGATDGRFIRVGARTVIGVVAARPVGVAHTGAADRRLIGESTRTAAVELAALVVDHVAHAGLADQACGRGRTTTVQHRAGMWGIAGNGRAIAEFGRAGVIRLVAPLAVRTISVHVATVGWAAEAVIAAAPRATNRGLVASGTRTAIDVP